MHICFRANGLGSFTVGPCHAISFCPQIKSLVGSIIFTIACGGGFAFLTTESRPEKQWVPAGDREKTEDDTTPLLFLRVHLWQHCVLDLAPESGEHLYVGHCAFVGRADSPLWHTDRSVWCLAGRFSNIRGLMEKVW